MEQSLFKFQWRIGNNFLCSRSLPLAFAHFGCVFSRSPLFGRTMLFLLISNFSQKFHFNLYLFDFFSSWLLNVEFFFFGVLVFLREAQDRKQQRPLLIRSKWLIAYNVSYVRVSVAWLRSIVNCCWEFTTIIHSFSNCNV